MKIIDRYLLAQFVRTFVIFFCSFTGLYIIVDAFANLEDFLTYGERHGSVAVVLCEYYGYRTLSFFNVTSGVLALISAMFTVTGFQRNNELTALMAAGIPKRRIVLSVVAAGIVVSLAAAVNREAVIPNVREKLARSAQDWLGDAPKALNLRYDNKTNIRIAGDSTVAAEQRIDQPNFRLPLALQDYGGTLSAKSAYYHPPQGDRPGGYLFRQVRQPRDLASKPSLHVDGEPVILMPHDVAWLADDECFVVSDVTFEQLAAGTSWVQYASTAELMAGIRNESMDFGPEVRVSVHARLVQPILDVALLLLGLPIVLTRENRNAFLAIALCGLIVLAFTVVVFGCHYLGSVYLIEPSRAAWLPVAIFVPLAVLLSDPLRE